MASENTESKGCYELWYQEWLMSENSQDLGFDVYHGSQFFFYPLSYLGGDVLHLRLPRLSRLSYSQICDMLLKEIKEDIWAWYFCLPSSSLEEGLTLVEDDNDVKKLYDMAELHGLVEIYVCHQPQVHLVTYYHKNLSFDSSDDDLTFKIKSHEKKKKDVDCLSFEELMAWEEEEKNSPAYLRTPYIKPFVEASLFRGKSEFGGINDLDYIPPCSRSTVRPYVSNDFEDSWTQNSTVTECLSNERGFEISPLRGKNLFNDFEAADNHDLQDPHSTSLLPSIQNSPLKCKRFFNDIDGLPTVGSSTVVQYVSKKSRFETGTLKSRRLFDEFEEVGSNQSDDMKGDEAISLVNDQVIVADSTADGSMSYPASSDPSNSKVL